MSKLRTYAELFQLETFEERFEYLKLGGQVGESTFGWDRWINQRFYHSAEWRNIRSIVIIRDGSRDLGIPGYEISSGLLIHHMNPFSLEELQHDAEALLNPNYLITTSKQTHNAIHYGDKSLLPRGPIERKPRDTTLW
jgi:hypothetical protein